MDGGSAVVSLCVPLLAIEVGGSYDDLGALRATHALTYAVGAFFLGRLADRVGYQRAMAACCLAMTVIYLGYYRVDAVAQLFGLALLTGLGLAAFWPSVQAWLGREQNRAGLRRAIGGFNMSWSLGLIVGPGVAGALYAAYADFSFVLAAILAAALCVAITLVRVRESAPVELEEESASIAAARRFLPVAWIANFATFFATGVIRALFPKLATDLGVATEHLGYLMALIGVAQFTAFTLVARSDRWQFKLWPLALVQLCALAGLCALAFGDSLFVFAVGLLLHGLLIGFTFTSSGFYSLHSLSPAGRRIGFHEAILGSGNLVGPLLGGLAGEHIGARAPYLLAAGVIAVAMVMQWMYLRRNK
tara:strand:+ start:114 stop:1199 length:1086 start_codon:yes stop_codon:yes gene_type:complete